MPNPPPRKPAPKPAASLEQRRLAAQKALWWRAQLQLGWHVVFLALLAVDVFLGAGIVLRAASESRSAIDLGSRLFGDAEEAAWLGWLTYFGWLLFDRMTRARRMRRSARLARLLLRRGHPRWYYPLAT